MNFNDYVKKYQTWKIQEKKLSGKIDKAELAELRESWSKKVAEHNGKKKLNEALSNFRKFKEKKTGESKITYKEYQKIREAVRQETSAASKEKLQENAPKAGSFEVLVENYRKYKKAQGEGEKVTYKEVKSLREAFTKTKGRLREADPNFDPNAGMDAGGGADMGMDPTMGADPNAAMGADAGGVDATTVQAIIDALTPLAGGAAQPTTDLGADAGAAIPPVDGGGAMGAVNESTIEKFKKYVRIKEKREATAEEIARLREKITPPKSRVDQLKERIELREKQLREANAAQQLGTKVLAALGGPQARPNFEPDKSGSPGSNSDVASNPNLIDVPAASKLQKGYSSNPSSAPSGNTWPTKEPKSEPPMQGAGAKQISGAGSKKIKESEELEESENLEECAKKPDPLNESVASVTDAYVTSAINTPKLDFAKIRESLATGMLG